MSTLFGRKWYLKVGNVELTDLDIEFKVFKSIKREPNGTNAPSQLVSCMETNYNGHSRDSGVYQIRNIKNGKVYIGSTIEFKRRATQHLKSLNRNVHRNKHLQASYNKHGSESFVFEILEATNRDERFEAEQRHIDLLIAANKWNLAFNILKSVYYVSDETREKMSDAKTGEVRSDEYKRKMSVATTGRTRTPEHRESLSKANKGKRHTPESRAKMSAAKKGKKFSEEQREGFKGRGTGRKDSAETRIRKSLGRTGIVFSEDHKENLRKAQQKRRLKEKEAVNE